MTGSDLILKPRPVTRVEVCKSFSYKLDMKRYDPWYENRDFFCSAKSECSIEDSVEVAAALYQFCRASVLRDVKEYIAEVKQQIRERQKGVA